MKLKKLLTLSLAGALLIGGVVTTNAAELDLAWYAAKNPDVVAEMGDSPEALKLHYEMFGKKEGRAANDHDVEAQLRRLFKAEEYAVLYPDVKAAFGEDAEAMFQHYIGFGLLEARRPAENISQAAAVTLKTTVEKALADVGVVAEPGSAQLVEIITGTIPADEGGAAVQAALVQAAPEVEKAVAAVVEETTNPAPAPSSGGSSSSSSSSSSSDSSTLVEDTKKLDVYGAAFGDGRNVSLSKWWSKELTKSVDSENKKVYGCDAGVVLVSKEYEYEGFYWFAVSVPKELYTFVLDEGKAVHQWLWTGSDYVDITDNSYKATSSLTDAYGFLIGENDPYANNKTTVKIALAPADSDGKIATENVVEFNIGVEYRGSDIEVYNNIKADSTGKLVDDYNGNPIPLKAKGGDGSETKPYEYEAIPLLQSSVVDGHTYWIIVDRRVFNADGSARLPITSLEIYNVSNGSATKVEDVGLGRYFTDNMKSKNYLFGIGDDGEGGVVKVNVNGTWYKLTLTGLPDQDSNVTKTTIVAEEITFQNEVVEPENKLEEQGGADGGTVEDKNTSADDEEVDETPEEVTEPDSVSVGETIEE